MSAFGLLLADADSSFSLSPLQLRAPHRHFLPLLQSYLLPLIVALELGCWEWVGAGAGAAGRHPSPASAACCCLPGIDVEFASPEALVGGNLESFRRWGDG